MQNTLKDYEGAIEDFQGIRVKFSTSRRLPIKRAQNTLKDYEVQLKIFPKF